MGRYLVVNDQENNTKSISYLMGDIIRDIIGTENATTFDGWKLTRTDLSKCIIATESLFESEEKLNIYIDRHKDTYWASVSKPEEIRNNLQWIINCFANNLALMILNNKRHTDVWWKG